MKRTYQISKAVAIERFQKLVEDRNPAVQLVFPLADMLGLMRAGLGNLVIELGRQFFEEVMKTEALEVAGATGLRQANRKLNRWGKAKGFCECCLVRHDRSSWRRGVYPHDRLALISSRGTISQISEGVSCLTGTAVVVALATTRA
jgi:hypothetical protein